MNEEREEHEERELARCTKCGFCLPTCPTYGVTGAETDSPRGRLELLSRRLGGTLRAREVRSALNECLLCGSCTAACPQGIPTARMVRRAKSREGAGLFGLLVRGVFSHPEFLRVVGRFSRRANGAGKAPGGVAPDRASPIRVAYFPGCSHGFWYPETKVATGNVLVAAGAGVWELSPLCCGLPLWAAGDREGAAALAGRVLTAFRAAGEPTVVTDCASCAATLREYPELLPREPAAVRLAAKVWDLAAFLAETGYESPPGPRIPGPLAVTYHQPCHARQSGEGEATRRLLESLPGVEYREAKGYDACCGGAGLWGLRHAELSGKILARKMAAFAATEAGLVVTSCPACRMQLERGVRRAGLKLAVGSVAGMLVRPKPLWEEPDR